MSDASHAYIGRLPDCGCVVAVRIDTPDHPRDVARDTARFIRDGLVIERVTVQESRDLLTYCRHTPPKSRPAKQGALL